MSGHHTRIDQDSSRSSTDLDELLPPSTPPSPSPTQDRAPSVSLINPAIKARLYASHFLSTWNARGFEFGAVLFLTKIYPGTLLQMSILALIRALSAIIFSPSVGTFIDSTNRLKVVRISIIVQRAAVALSCLLLWIMLKFRESLPWMVSMLFFLFLISLSCVEKLCAIMNMISVERDWVVVIGAGEESSLRVMNAQMRRIDLFCKIVSPLAIALIDGCSSEWAILITLIVNTVSISIEYVLIATVYRRIPALAMPKAPPAQTTTLSSSARTTVRRSKLITSAQMFWLSFKAYVSHRTFLPSFSLNLLYFTVISFASQMTTYLLATGMSSTTLGLLRTVSTAFELSATFIAPYLMTRIGPIRAGIWSQSWLVVCVTFVAGVLWSSDSTTASTLSTALLVCGVVISRVGTWSFDLCAQLIIQDEISAESRGSFSSMEASVRNLFELCRFAATIVFSEPYQFKYPVLMTLVAVWLSASVYAKFVRDRRGHLLHMPGCLKGVTDGVGFQMNGERDGAGGRGRYEVLETDETTPRA